MTEFEETKEQYFDFGSDNRSSIVPFASPFFSPSEQLNRLGGDDTVAGRNFDKSLE